MTPAVQPTDSTSAGQAADPKPRGSYRQHFIRDKKKAPVFHLQDRDTAIVKAVFENRYLTAPLLAQLFPPDPAGRARKGITTPPLAMTYNNLRVRLRNLFHDSYLFRFRTVVGGEHIYSVDTKGVQLMKERQISLPLPEEGWRPNKEMPATLFVDHTLMVARLRAALTAATRVHPSMRLASFQREGLDLKAEWRHNGKRVYVNPDAFFMLRNESLPEGRQHLAFFLEADRSTMTLARLIEKYQRYSAMYAERVHTQTFGIPSFRVLTVCKSKERASNALKMANGEKSPIPKEHRIFFYFTTEESYAEHPANIFSTIWRRVGDEPRDPQRAIIASPLPRT